MKEENDLRYDITVVPAKMLGDEFNKTKGHYHVGAYQEIYTVLKEKQFILCKKEMETRLKMFMR